MKTALIFVMVLLGFPANAQVSFSGGTSNAITYTSGMCATGNQDDCTKSDLVLRTKDKTILLRGVYGCKELAQKLTASPDTNGAECFK